MTYRFANLLRICSPSVIIAGNGKTRSYPKLSFYSPKPGTSLLVVIPSQTFCVQVFPKKNALVYINFFGFSPCLTTCMSAANIQDDITIVYAMSVLSLRLLL